MSTVIAMDYMFIVLFIAIMTESNVTCLENRLSTCLCHFCDMCVQGWLSWINWSVLCAKSLKNWKTSKHTVSELKKTVTAEIANSVVCINAWDIFTSDFVRINVHLSVMDEISVTTKHSLSSIVAPAQFKPQHLPGKLVTM